MSFRALAIFSGVAMVVAMIVMSVFETSCSNMPPETPRERVRAAVEVTATAVAAMDQACARVARANHDAELAGRCARAYSAARISLISVGEGVDHWDDAPASRDDIACAVMSAANQVDVMARELAARDLPVPAIVHDSKRLVAVLGACNVP